MSLRDLPYREYLETEHWKKMRLAAIERAVFRCQLCNSADNLQAHHRTYDRIGEELPHDLFVLCERCHERFHDIISSDSEETMVHISTAIGESLDAIDEGYSSGTRKDRLRTGFLNLDEILGGLGRQELIVIASRPGVGKTSFALNLATHVLEEGHGVLFFSLEQSRIEIGNRLLSSVGKVDGLKFRKMSFTNDDTARLVNAAKATKEYNLFIDDRAAQTIRSITQKTHALKKSHDIRLVVVDYLQLLEPGRRGETRQQEVAAVSRKLKWLSKEANVPVIALSQLNRTSEERHDYRPRLSDLRESGAIEQDADTVILLHRPELYDDRELPGLAEVIVAKQRNGPIGTFLLAFFKPFTSFANFMEGDPPINEE